jgi:hypothetical protein
MSTPETGGPHETPSSGDLPRSPDQRPAGATEPPTGPRHQPQANGLAIALGAVLGKRVPERAIQIGAAVLFFVFGAVLTGQGLILLAG